jgi:hypothetical protein
VAVTVERVVGEPEPLSPGCFRVRSSVVASIDRARTKELVTTDSVEPRVPGPGEATVELLDWKSVDGRVWLLTMEAGEVLARVVDPADDWREVAKSAPIVTVFAFAPIQGAELTALKRDAATVVVTDVHKSPTTFQLRLDDGVLGVR